MSDDYLVAVEDTAHDGQHLRMVACPIQGCDDTLGEDYDKYARHLAAEHGPEDVGLSASSPRVATDGGQCTGGTDRCLGCGGLLSGGSLESAISSEDGAYCYDCVDTPRVAFVGCGSAKIDLDDGETVAAKDLYDSNYFGLKQEYSEELCDEWKILSAKHGLLDPETEIESYDASLNPRSDTYIGDYEAGVWAVETAQEIATYTSFKIPYTQYVVLAGEDYVAHRHIERALGRLRHVAFPFRRDDLGGIGDQQKWLREEIDTYHPPGQAGLDHYAVAGGGDRSLQPDTDRSDGGDE